MSAPVIDITWVSRITFVVVAYYLFLYVVALVNGRRSRTPSARLDATSSPFMVLVVPAHNEEAVIAQTLTSLRNLSYPDRLVLVMNDGSTDRTSEIARQFACDGVRVIDRGRDIAGRGKGEVLNHAFRVVRDLVASGDASLGGRGEQDVVIGVMDADGQLERDALGRVAPYFADPDVAGVQIGVRIANATDNWVARMQDMEFVGFSAMVQTARDRFGSVGLGGNGQFTRLSALTSLRRDPWTKCLTEDLELSLSLAEGGGVIRYCPSTYVAQQGLTTVRPLLRQRTRWIQGHYQCWRHLPALLSTRSLGLVTKLDLTAYLVMITFIVLVSGGVLATLLGELGVITPVNSFLMWVPAGSPRNVGMVAVSFGPLLAFLTTYQRNARQPLRWWEVPAFGMAFALYAYLFLVSQVWAWSRMATGRGSWAKTPRTAATAAVA